ncbi:hypothetical protein BT93_E2262 [Corymbia citriodora subsp. variegata]|nr:hypothetical protein BT93_E2262 [Corymbia citriodora subsp. variegata]
MMARVPLILQQWEPMLELKKGEHSSIPVWIRLKNLPYGLWSATGLSKVASAIGRPLYVDQRTEQLKMISFARVCVELSTTKPCHDTITVCLNGATRIVDVEYEWKPLSCTSCGVFGHRCAANAPSGVISQPPSTEQLNRTEEQVSFPAGVVDQTTSVLDSNAGQPPTKVAGHALEDSRLAKVCSPSEPTSEGTWQQVYRRQQRPPVVEPTELRNQQPRSVSHLAIRASHQKYCSKPAAASSYNLTLLLPVNNIQHLQANPCSQSSCRQFLPDHQRPQRQKCYGLIHKLALLKARTQIFSGLPSATPSIKSKPSELASGSRPSPGSPAVKTKSVANKRWPKRRGLMNPAKQAEVRQLVRLNNLCCVGILETKVSTANFNNISSGLIPGWEWISNYDYSSRGRIWVGWNPSLVGFNALLCSDQLIHGELKFLNSGIVLTLSVAYGEHTFVARRPLWHHLINLSLTLKESPWMVAGDFNAIRDSSDRMGSPDIWIPAFDEFKDCLDQAELIDLRYVGFRYTWSTSSGINRKQRKIDRVLVNNHWCMVFSFSEASFLAPGISDHSPMVVRILAPASRRTPFKFFNFWLTHPEFSSLVDQAWGVHVTGSPMFKLYTRLKILKGRLKCLNRDNFSDISMRKLFTKILGVVRWQKRKTLNSRPTLTYDPWRSLSSDKSPEFDGSRKVIAILSSSITR